jgi:hypothetical protein
MALLQGQTQQPSTVRPDYGLTGAMISAQRSPYERTLAPGETRTAGDLQSMLGEVILAAGAGASPVTGPRGVELARTAARVRPGGEAAFNKWFEGSAAVDKAGAPLTLYHGTGPDVGISEFRMGKGFLTTSPERANSYAQSTRAALTGKGTELDGSVTPVYAKVRRPFVVKGEGDVDTWRSPEKMAELRAAGYDGIITQPNQWTGERIVLPIVSSSQIKSATGNRGTYNPASGDIRE